MLSLQRPETACPAKKWHVSEARETINSLRLRKLKEYISEERICHTFLLYNFASYVPFGRCKWERVVGLLTFSDLQIDTTDDQGRNGMFYKNARV